MMYLRKYYGGQPRARRGAAFLVLVVLILLLVLSSTRMLIRNEVATRRGESARVSARSMIHAIEVARPALEQSNQTLRLPIDVATDQSIEVSLNASQSVITARWLRGDQVIDQMNQPFKDHSESNP